MIAVKANCGKTFAQLDKVKKAIERATKDSLKGIRETTVDAVTDNSNWNENAIYKGGPQKGQPYDLEFSGKLLGTIGDARLNSIEKMESGYILGIGHIPSLDSLPARGTEPIGGYWRLVVYGRASIPGWKFIAVGRPGGVRANKLTGLSVPSADDSISSSEATMMFDNGLLVAERSYADILANTFAKELRGY